MLSQTGPKLYYVCSTMLSLGPQGRMRCGLSLAPCIAKRRDFAALAIGASPPTTARRPFCWPWGNTGAPGVRRGFDFLE